MSTWGRVQSVSWKGGQRWREKCTGVWTRDFQRTSDTLHGSCFCKIRWVRNFLFWIILSIENALKVPSHRKAASSAFNRKSCGIKRRKNLIASFKIHHVMKIAYKMYWDLCRSSEDPGMLGSPRSRSGFFKHLFLMFSHICSVRVVAVSIQLFEYTLQITRIP